MTRVLAVLRDAVPRGRLLSETSWQRRHRAVVALLLVHAVALSAYAALVQHDLPLAALSAAVPGLGAWGAQQQRSSRLLRSVVASLATMLTSVVVVHVFSGYTEAHFHFFVMVPVIALYEDWLPFGVGVGVVLLHHGVMGVAAPQSVYHDPEAWAHPWRFAVVHAALFGACCLGSVVNWRLHESARAVEQSLTSAMAHRASHDLLTGLPNRAHLLERGRTILSAGALLQQPTALLMLDLDRFKEINDVLGHAYGDVLLREVGPRLATAVRDRDVFARLGGDEFAAVLAGADLDDATRVAQRLLALLETSVEVDGVTLDVEASIGLAVSVPGSELDVETLLQRADMAMYAAKRDRSGFAAYEQGHGLGSRQTLALLGDLRRALAEDQIVLHYQPKVALPSMALQGVEALARWQHPERGLLGPGEFIPAAESTGLIVPLTLRVLDLALTQCAAWSAAGHDVPVAVNLSPRCLGQDDLLEQVLRLLAQHGVPPHLLKLEITENTLAQDPERALATLTALHDAGVVLSIDDFGTGYSSMSYLKRLPVAELKIDRSFVLDLLTDADNAVLVRSVVDLGHNLGLRIVAEGVEDLPTLDLLWSTGCDEVQGYHVARPMPPEAFEAWLAAPALAPLDAAFLADRP